MYPLYAKHSTKIYITQHTCCVLEKLPWLTDKYMCFAWFGLIMLIVLKAFTRTFGHHKEIGSPLFVQFPYAAKYKPGTGVLK